MPKAESTRLAGSPSLTARMRGMPPATAASKPRRARLRRAASKNSGPWWARSALLAVTTCLPASRARRMKVRAGSSPPTSSMTICTAGSASTLAASLTRGRVFRSSPSRGRVSSASAMAWRRRRQPARSSMSAPWFWRTLTTPLPTVPRPRRPILISFMAGPKVALRAQSAGAQSLETAERLSDALLVLDESEPDIALAVLAEADARGDRDLALLDQHLGELERSHGAESVGNGCPHEHGALGLGHGPADLVEPVHEDVAALLVELHDVAHHGLLALQGDDGRDLDGLEGQDEHLGLGPGKTGRLLQAGEEVFARHQGHRAQVAVGDDDRVGVDGVGRVRHQHPVPRLEDGQGQVGHALLGADGGDGLGLGIQLDLVMVPIPGRDGLAEPRDSP